MSTRPSQVPRAIRRPLAAALLAAACALPAGGAEEPANDLRVRAVAAQLVCYCGCSTQSVAYCSCDVAQAERRKIQADLDAGKSGDAIVAAWVDKYGPRILIEPPPKGFNLVGWLLPSVVVATAGLMLAVQIRRWSRGRAAPGTAVPGAAGLDPRYLERLEDELRKREP